MGLNVKILKIFTILFGKIGLKIKEIWKADYELPLEDDYRLFVKDLLNNMKNDLMLFIDTN